MEKKYISDLKAQFIDTYQKVMIENGANPAPRAVFRKQHGVVHGELSLTNNLPVEKLVGNLGFFGIKDNFKCVLRFSSDTAPKKTDVKSTIGLGLKIFDLPNNAEGFDGPNTDFIFQNIDVFFAQNAQQMVEFTQISSSGDINQLNEYYRENKELKRILDQMEKYEDSCLTTAYYPIIPFRLGEKHMIKLRLKPAVEENFPVIMKQKDYLAKDLQQKLSNDSYQFILEGQIKELDEKIADNLQLKWDESFIEIGRLNLPKQDLNLIGVKELGDHINFNCWRINSLNQPLGSIAEARRDVYKYGAETRYSANALEFREPKGEICPFHAQNKDEKIVDHEIVSAAIYPSIGIMRVGNSDEYYIGPQVPEPIMSNDLSFYRDREGKIKRQAAEFRIYGLNIKGEVVKELTHPDIKDKVEIDWSCHLANQKAAWYQFNLALDIPEANEDEYKYSFKRNSEILDRMSLVIDGGVKNINSKSINKSAKFKGKFLRNTEVYLGEMFFDKNSSNSKRLHVLGGKGISKNVKNEIALDFANNDGWYDDTSDGPVTAIVKFNNKEINVKPAWVICAPPDYAPVQQSVRTMWDLMRDLSVSQLNLPSPLSPSFSYDIFPIFKRMTELQWVNKGFLTTFGFNGAYNFNENIWIEKLRDGTMNNLEFRRQMFNQFRQFNLPGSQSPALWPWLYGDAMEIKGNGSPRQHSTLTDLQIKMLQQWVDGNFIDDWDKYKTNYINPKPLDEYPVEEQADLLTRAALDFCLADAFHPGCEMTWPVRISTMYDSPFRFNFDKDHLIKDNLDYGPFIDQTLLNKIVNPFEFQVAGGITRWMAIPWQTDTASCKDGYDSSYDSYIPTFWPARVPNEIITYKQFKALQEKQGNPEEQLEIFNQRFEWLEDLPGNPTIYSPYQEIINKMVTHFDAVGTVLPMKLDEIIINNDNTEIPDTVQVALTSSYTKIINIILKETRQKLIDNVAKDKVLEILSDNVLNSSQLQIDEDVKKEAENILNNSEELENLLSKVQQTNKDLQIEYVKPNQKIVTIHERFRRRFNS